MEKLRYLKNEIIISTFLLKILFFIKMTFCLMTGLVKSHSDDQYDNKSWGSELVKLHKKKKANFLSFFILFIYYFFIRLMALLILKGNQNLDSILSCFKKLFLIQVSSTDVVNLINGPAL